jgi:hypothetical protein
MGLSSRVLTAFLIALALMPIPPALGEEDTTPPELATIRFSPEAIKTISGPAEVTIGFVATDDLSGVEYFEAAFRDPSGVFSQSVSAKFNPALSQTATAKIKFPRFSNSGAWTLTQVFLSDAAGNTTILTTDQLIRRGLRTSLQVESVQDTVSPKLLAFDFAPREIDTSRGPVDVNVRYAAADDLSGIAYFEMNFVSPSGALRRGGRVKLADSALSKTGSIVVNFPWMSEAGQWMLDSVLLADSAGNTLCLSADEAARFGFPTVLNVKSAADTVSPTLLAIQVVRPAIDTTNGPATVEVRFAATDDASGVRSFEIVFAGPSGSEKQGGSIDFPPQKAITKSMTITFPQSSEPGVWTIETVILSDVAGNTLVLDSAALTAAAGTLRVR